MEEPTNIITDNNTSQSSSNEFNNIEEGGRGCRSKKKFCEPICCPVCSVTLRITEVENHLTLEIDKLTKISTIKSKVHHSKNVLSSNSSGSSSSSNNEDTPDKPWDVFQKVRANRQTRHRVKTRKRKSDDIICPVCNKDPNEDITLHVEKCLRQQQNTDSESDESIDVEAFEEYEWAGQSRIRLTTLLPGGVSSLGTTLNQTEEDEDLNVDEDDAVTYGSPQYTESDIILLPGEHENNDLRKAVWGPNNRNRYLSGFRFNTDHHTNNDPCINFVDEMEHSIFDDIEERERGESTSSYRGNNPLVEVLKNRIRELESRENKDETYKCLICMERYRTPVISVCCWHVHCEQCWLQTLGAKKLCPQCNMITSPSDLRKIYI